MGLEDQVNELKEKVMQVWAYKRALESKSKDNTKNRSNRDEKAIQEIGRIAKKMEEEIREFDKDFSFEGEYNKNQAKENDRFSRIRTKRTSQGKIDEAKKLYKEFKMKIDEMKKSKINNEQERIEDEQLGDDSEEVIDLGPVEMKILQDGIDAGIRIKDGKVYNVGIVEAKQSEITEREKVGSQDSRKNQLENELRIVAEEMRAAKDGGYYEGYAQLRSRYSHIVEELAELNDENREIKPSERSELQNSEASIWHPELTQEQIEELEAENIKPGDQEYNRYLWDHGIKPIARNDLDRHSNQAQSQEAEGPGNPGGSAGPEGTEKPDSDQLKATKPQKEKDPSKQGITPEQNNNQLPIRSFWEIYNSTCTQHVGSIAHTINQMSHMNILPPRNEDTLHKILSLPTIPLKVPIKLLAKIPNAIMRTDRKINEMRENVNGLDGAEFQALLYSPEKVNDMFGQLVKDSFDRDCLDPQFMKQYKVNNAYLDVVRERMTRERGPAIEYYNSQVRAATEEINRLENEVGRDNFTPDQERLYSQMVYTRQQATERGKELQTELNTFEEGSKRKSNSHRNISGWLLGAFNPDNRKQNEEMARLSMLRRESNDRHMVDRYTEDMHKYSISNTHLVGGTRNYLDRGKYSIESSVEALNKGAQTKGRMLLTDVALVSSVFGLVKQIQRNMENARIVNDHNYEIGGANIANKNIHGQSNGDVKVSDLKGAEKAQEAIIRNNVNSGFNQAERANLQDNGFVASGDKYVNVDHQVHETATNMAKNAESYMNKGDYMSALKETSNYVNSTNQHAMNITRNWTTANPQHDYTAFNFGASAKMDDIVNFFNSTIPGSAVNVNGTMVNVLEGLNYGIDPNAVIFATANAMYQGQREGRNAFRNQLNYSVPITPTGGRNERNASQRENDEPELEQ